jgi:hypothetical protein
MSRYRKVDPRIWNDEKFRELGDSAKLVFFMLLTHPNMTALGAMRGTISGLAEELGWESEAFREAFAEVLSKAMAEHDPKACLIALPKFIRYNQPESPNVVKAWVGALDLLPECGLKRTVLLRAKLYVEDMQEAFAKAFHEAFAKAMPNQKQEQKQKQKKKSPQPPKGAEGRVSFSTWLEQVKANGEKPIPESDSVFAYAEKVGIPQDFLRLHWTVFRDRYSDVSKRYIDWRKVFRNSVRGNWFRLWALVGDEYRLTTVGHQASRQHEEAA